MGLENTAQLEAENAKLRGRLGTDSNNPSAGSGQRSDKPPSNDGDKKRSVKLSLPKDKKGSQGDQKGHKGNPLKRVKQPDHMQTPIPKQCHCCGHQCSLKEYRLHALRA